MQRCPWAEQSELERHYHDTEWGVPLHDERRLFEFLCLEGVQAGLSWRTVLAKRERYREAFHGFEITRVAAMCDSELARCLGDPGLIRNRLKMLAIRNARATLAMMATEGSLDACLWSFVDGQPIINHWRDRAEVPTSTPLSERMSRELKKFGFRFVGSTICYALMQATGMVNDHLQGCFRRNYPARGSHP